MIIRPYKPEDCQEIVKLFYDTVHSVNAKDYTQEQLDVWAPKAIDIEVWSSSLSQNFTIVAVEGQEILGFGDVDNSGYFNRLYVHQAHQGRGIAGKILHLIEENAVANGLSSITTHASITAKSFFLKHGYSVIKEQLVKRGGQELTNFVMAKQLK